jgi:DNA-binding Xre family transcriptional regulator
MTEPRGIETPVIEPQVIEKDGEPAFAVLPIAEWRQLMQRLADLEDAQEIDAIARDPNRRMIPGDVVGRLLQGDHPLKVWREQRGLTRTELAREAGLTAGHVAHIETGRRQGTAETLRRLATALDVTVDDLVPIQPAAAEA